MRKIILLVVLFTLTGCSVLIASQMMGNASNETTLKRETARSIGKGISPDQVKISNIDRGAYNVSWVAKTPKGKFSCSADDMVHRVNCLK